MAEHFRNAVCNAAMSTFSKKTSKSADWFEAHSEKMTLIIEEKRNTLAAYKTGPSKRHLQVPDPAENSSKALDDLSTITGSKSARRYRLQLTQATSRGCMTVSTITGPTEKNTTHLESTTGMVIQDMSQQMDRWVKHYSELHGRENTVTENAQF